VDFALTPCHWGGICEQIDNPSHRDNFAHPPLCERGGGCPFIGNDSREARVHCHAFLHARPCPSGGLCATPEQQPHCILFTHPPICDRRGGARANLLLTRAAGMCESSEHAHLAQFTHPPQCPEGRLCPRLQDRVHAEQMRHVPTQCKFGTFCVKFADSDHTAGFAHPFLRVCPQ
jgi:hypothetical protein